MRIDDVSARALRYWEERQAAMSNNLANVETAGFKAERVFAQLLADGELVAVGRTDHSEGSLTPTGRDLDVALSGDGFLVVETPEREERWIRGGALSLSPEGMLVDMGGRAVLGEGGPIVVPPGSIEITAAGEVRVDGAPLDRLRLERAADAGTLERRGANLWQPSELKTALGPDEIQVRQGQLEGSNVDPIGSLVEMIEIQRAYTAIQRSMQTEDAMMQSIATEIGRVG